MMPQMAMIINISRDAAVNKILMCLFLHLLSSGALGIKRRPKHTRQTDAVRPVCGQFHGWVWIPRAERGIGAGNRLGSPGHGRGACLASFPLAFDRSLRPFFETWSRVRSQGDAELVQDSSNKLDHVFECFPSRSTSGKQSSLPQILRPRVHRRLRSSPLLVEMGAIGSELSEVRPRTP